MTWKHSALVFGLATAFLAHASHAEDVKLALIDSPDGRYLYPSSSGASKGPVKDVSAVVTSLLNLEPLTPIDEATSQQVAELVRPSPFDRPEGVVTISIAGAPSGPWPHFETATWLSGVSDGSVLGSFVALAGAKGARHDVLDVSTLPGCGEVCLDSMLQETLTSLGLDANYTALRSGSLRGLLKLRTPEVKDAVTLDLQEIPERLFAVELVSTWKTVANAAADKKSQRTQHATQDQPQLLERTLVSLQAILKAYGSGAAQYKAACFAMDKLLKAAVQQLQTAFDGRIVFVAAALNEQASKSIASLAAQQLSSSRLPGRTVLAANAKGDSPQYTEYFIAWIAMWCTFFLLLFFALAGCYCLRNMKFKQDSLLYGKNKAD